MLNFLRYVHSTTPFFPARFTQITSIQHCNVIDIPPDIDVERLNIISREVAFIECLEDQLAFVKCAKIITVHKSTNDDKEITIDNTNTKLIIVIGNVQNIRLTMDDPETIVYHRTFNYQ